MFNRAEEIFPLLAARAMRRFSGILPLHGAAHKKLADTCSFPGYIFAASAHNSNRTTIMQFFIYKEVNYEKYEKAYFGISCCRNALPLYRLRDGQKEERQ